MDQMYTFYQVKFRWWNVRRIVIEGKGPHLTAKADVLMNIRAFLDAHYCRQSKQTLLQQIIDACLQHHLVAC